MKLREEFPNSPDDADAEESLKIAVGELQEIFQHDYFLKANETKKKEIMLHSSTSKYESELDYPWDAYFGTDLSPYLKEKVILDLGCFNGGRGAAWFERYNLKQIFGIDVDQVYIDAATSFASIKQINAKYDVARGERLPYEDEMFDAVLSFDVFEHVQNVPNTLNECWRVLKPNGKLFVVFPSYFQPVEHHLTLVTSTPFFHYFFSGETLINAYNEILEERGQDAYWYARGSLKPEIWERCNTINGTTLRRFKGFIDNGKWKTILYGRKPIGSIGRNVSKKKWPLPFSYLFYPLTFVPGIQEIFLHRVVFVLEKESQ